MIYINYNRLVLPTGWQKKANDLTKELKKKTPKQRAPFIKKSRDDNWGHSEFLTALRKIVGNKCWYSEVLLSGSDPNVDHFRPKGEVKEIDNASLTATGKFSSGYWWLAFEPKNFRLAAMHANQRRVDKKTNGGKWDFFPVEGQRAKEAQKFNEIRESVLPLDPCSAYDMSLLWFDPDGIPGLRKGNPTIHEKLRIKVTVWLYHLDKEEIATARAEAMNKLRTDLITADAFYNLWQASGGDISADQKFIFDSLLSTIYAELADEAEFAGAKRCALNIARSEYAWIDDFIPLY